MNKNISAGLIAHVENYAQTAVALVKLESYFEEQGWQSREDIPETLLVAYGLVAALRSRLESPEMDALKEDVRELQEAQKWLTRTAVGALVLAVLDPMLSLFGG